MGPQVVRLKRREANGRPRLTPIGSVRFNDPLLHGFVKARAILPEVLLALSLVSARHRLGEFASRRRNVSLNRPIGLSLFLRCSHALCSALGVRHQQLSSRFRTGIKSQILPG